MVLKTYAYEYRNDKWLSLAVTDMYISIQGCEEAHIMLVSYIDHTNLYRLNLGADHNQLTQVRNKVKLTFTQFHLKTIAHTCLLLQDNVVC
jgi:hypothetical protein